jgi:hypothetical protein
MVREARKVSLARLTTGGMMRVHRAAALGAAVAFNIIAMGVLGTSAATAASGESAAPIVVVSTDEMGYNGLSPDEMGYN